MRIMEVGDPVQRTGFSLVELLAVIAGLILFQTNRPDLTFGIDPIIFLYPGDKSDKRMILRIDGCSRRKWRPRI
jgi:hypothetical protein